MEDPSGHEAIWSEDGANFADSYDQLLMLEDVDTPLSGLRWKERLEMSGHLVVVGSEVKRGRACKTRIGKDAAVCGDLRMLWAFYLDFLVHFCSIPLNVANALDEHTVLQTLTDGDAFRQQQIGVLNTMPKLEKMNKEILV